MLQWLKRRIIRLYVRLRYGEVRFFNDPRGPIEELGWGKFVIRGKRHSGGDEPSGAGADIRVVGNDVSAWAERRGHVLQPDMITGISFPEVDVLIIGLGIHGAVVCSPEVLAAIRARGFAEVFAEPTPEACRRFNTLSGQGKKVALLAHGTC